MAFLRILNLDPVGYSPRARDILAGVGRVDDRRLTREELIREVAAYDVLVLRFAHRIDAEVIAAAPRLKAIATNVTGLDRVDLDAARARGIAVLSLKGETRFLKEVSATAELTWGLLLALVRQLPAACRSAARGRWTRDAFLGSELRGKRLGIVGYGRIGSMVGAYGLAFGMAVRAYDPVPRAVDGVHFHDSLLGLAADSDILTLHVPLDERTHRLVDSRVLSALPPRAVVINTSRGEVIDETALLDALDGGRLAGAALDVLAGEHAERFLDGNRMVAYVARHDNLLITPHIGGVTRESWERTEVFIAEKVQDFFRPVRGTKNS